MRPTRYLTAVPAYGRDYKNQAQVLADWTAGMDFLIQDFEASGYINKEDKPAEVVLNIRYSRLQKIMTIK